MRKSIYPFFTTARYKGVCAETGRPIMRGDKVAFYPATRKVYAYDSQQAQALRAQEFARAYNMADANY